MNPVDSVALSTQTSSSPGKDWLVEKNFEDNSYSFKCGGSEPGGKYLDAYTIGGKVYLSPQKNGHYTGTHWAVERNLEDGSYSFRCLGPQEGGYKYLDAYTMDGKVYLSPQKDGHYTGTHWDLQIAPTEK